MCLCLCEFIFFTIYVKTELARFFLVVLGIKWGDTGSFAVLLLWNESHVFLKPWKVNRTKIQVVDLNSFCILINLIASAHLSFNTINCIINKKKTKQWEGEIKKKNRFIETHVVINIPFPITIHNRLSIYTQELNFVGKTKTKQNQKSLLLLMSVQCV